ncbi:MAG: hypothetical protein CVT98_05645, partial [Bacteroidetes bacterium HGW-Bacteroidetes-15]
MLFLQKKKIMNKIFPFLLIIIIIAGCKQQERAIIKPPPIIEEEIDTADANLTENKFQEAPQKPVEIDYYKELYLRYEDFIYKKNINTIIIQKTNVELSLPIIALNSNDKLLLEFDDLDANYQEYKYSLIHCNADWTPSELEKTEYLEGFYENIISEYEHSINTIQPYIHYELEFPNQDLNITKTGNYLLLIYIDDKEKVENLVLSKRFLIYDSKLNIEANVKRATLIEDKNYKQEIDFSIDTKNFSINNPYRDLKIVIRKNARWDNVITNLKPKLVRGDVLDYNYDRENVFSGGNEYREVDIKSLKYQTMNIQNIKYQQGYYHVYLLPDKKRSFKNYSTIKDINGRQYIKNEDAKNSSKLEGEYVYVHFFLEYPAPLIDGDIFIMGALTDWNFDDNSKMKYNYNRKGYDATIYMKQGYYNYLYAFVENRQNVGDESFVEGQHYETENDYLILVYYREPGTFYDQLI